MIDLKLLNENKPIELELEQNSKGGTKDYNDLDNKPTINGKTLQGNLTLEDLGIIVNAVKDVLINGKTIVDENGVANIPIADTVNKLGLVKWKSGYGVKVDSDGMLNLEVAQLSHIDTRASMGSYSITTARLDYALKQGMCDGKGAEWSATEKAMARNRMGIDTWEEVADITIKEDIEYINIEFDKAYREIYVYVSQDGCEMKHTSGTRLIYPRLNRAIDHTDKNGHLMSYVSLNATYYDIVLIAKNHDNQWIERYTQCINPQKNTTSAGINAKYIDKGFHNKIDEYDELNFYGVCCSCTNKGTRIRVLGVRA